MKRILLAIIILLAVSACTVPQRQYALTSGMIGVEASVLRNQYSNVERALREKQEKDHIFTDEEWRKLLNVDAAINVLASKYDAIVALKVSEVSLQDVEFMWGLVAHSYKEARQVIMAHWSEFSPSTQILLNTFDNQAELTSDRINELLTNPNNKNINEAVVLLTGVMTTAVKMLALIM